MVLTASILGFCLSVLLTLWPPTAWAEVPFYTITALGPQGVHAISSEGNVAVGWLGFRSGDHGAQEFSPTFHALGTLGGPTTKRMLLPARGLLDSPRDLTTCITMPFSMRMAS